MTPPLRLYWHRIAELLWLGTLTPRKDWYR